MSAAGRAGAAPRRNPLSFSLRLSGHITDSATEPLGTSARQPVPAADVVSVNYPILPFLRKYILLVISLPMNVTVPTRPSIESLISPIHSQPYRQPGLAVELPAGASGPRRISLRNVTWKASFCPHAESRPPGFRPWLSRSDISKTMSTRV